MPFLRVSCGVLFFVAILALPLFSQTKDEGVAMQILDQWKGTYSAAEKSHECVVRSHDEWRKVWQMIAGLQDPMPELPKIDFEKAMVVAVFLGQQSSGGYAVAITRVDENDEIVVTVEQTVPRAGAMAAAVITSPYHAVCVPRSEKQVRFSFGKAPSVVFVAEMERVPTMEPAENASGWTEEQKASYAAAITGATEAWKAQCPALTKQLTAEKVRELSRWAKPQMEGYKAVPALEKAVFSPLGLDAKREFLILEATLDTLPTHSPLVTRWLKAFVRYNIAAKRIDDIVITIRGERLE